MKTRAKVHFHGHTTDHTQTITSMEIDFQKVGAAGPNRAVAVQVGDRVRAGDTVYRLLETEAAEEE